jgi:hypothetical protein
VIQGAIREAREETGVLIDPVDLAFSHVVHDGSPEGEARIGFFFTVVRWQGAPANLEPHKWANPARTPANAVPYTATALAAITSGAASPLTAGDTGRTFPLPDHARAFAVMSRFGRTAWRKARGICSSLPQPDAGRLPTIASGNALPGATTYYLGMSADAHEESDTLVPTDVVADPADASAAWRHALKELLGDKQRFDSAAGPSYRGEPSSGHDRPAGTLDSSSSSSGPNCLFVRLAGNGLSPT